MINGIIEGICFRSAKVIIVLFIGEANQIEVTDEEPGGLWWWFSLFKLIQEISFEIPLRRSVDVGDIDGVLRGKAREGEGGAKTPMVTAEKCETA